MPPIRNQEGVFSSMQNQPVAHTVRDNQQGSVFGKFGVIVQQVDPWL